MIMRRDYKGISINTTVNTHETVFELIKGNNEQKVVVDVPCGKGAFIQRLKDSRFRKIIVFDIENILEIEHDDFVQGDMTKTFPLDDSSCDVLVCIDGIEHISRQVDFVSEAARVLKKDGEFVVSTPNISSLRSRWKWFWTGHHNKCKSPLDECNPNPLHHISMISFHELRYLFHTNGFTISEVKTNRMKPISFVYSVFLPLIWLATKIVYSKAGVKEGTGDINRAVFKQMFSKEVLFGETIIIKGIKS